MTKSHSSNSTGPALSGVYCDGCGKWYQELVVLVHGRHNGLVGRLLCIECDPVAESLVKLTELGERKRLQ